MLSMSLCGIWSMLSTALPPTIYRGVCADETVSDIMADANNMNKNLMRLQFELITYADYMTQDLFEYVSFQIAAIGLVVDVVFAVVVEIVV